MSNRSQHRAVLVISDGGLKSISQTNAGITSSSTATGTINTATVTLNAADSKLVNGASFKIGTDITVYTITAGGNTTTLTVSPNLLNTYSSATAVTYICKDYGSGVAGITNDKDVLVVYSSDQSLKLIDTSPSTWGLARVNNTRSLSFSKAFIVDSAGNSKYPLKIFGDINPNLIESVVFVPYRAPQNQVLTLNSFSFNGSVTPTPGQTYTLQILMNGLEFLQISNANRFVVVGLYTCQNGNTAQDVVNGLVASLNSNIKQLTQNNILPLDTSNSLMSFVVGGIPTAPTLQITALSTEMFTAFQNTPNLKYFNQRQYRIDTIVGRLPVETSTQFAISPIISFSMTETTPALEANGLGYDVNYIENNWYSDNNPLQPNGLLYNNEEIFPLPIYQNTNSKINSKYHTLEITYRAKLGVRNQSNEQENYLQTTLFFEATPGTDTLGTGITNGIVTSTSNVQLKQVVNILNQFLTNNNQAGLVINTSTAINA